MSDQPTPRTVTRRNIDGQSVAVTVSSDIVVVRRRPMRRLVRWPMKWERREA